MDKKYRIMIAKVGCDLHERGALTMVNAFRDAGYEVISTGRYQSCDYQRTCYGRNEGIRCKYSSYLWRSDGC